MGTTGRARSQREAAYLAKEALPRHLRGHSQQPRCVPALPRHLRGRSQQPPLCPRALPLCRQAGEMMMSDLGAMSHVRDKDETTATTVAREGPKVYPKENEEEGREAGVA